MASSPATPDKANIEAAELSRASGHSFNQVKSASKVQHASVLDPSPASTYGDTAGTSSVPATPLDNRKTGKRTFLPFRAHDLKLSVFLVPRTQIIA